MSETPIQAMPPSCLTCKHHRFDLVLDGITCEHPVRPDAAPKVVHWAVGCQQHTPKKGLLDQ